MSQPSLPTPAARAGVLRPLLRSSLPATGDPGSGGPGTDGDAGSIQMDELHGEAQFNTGKAGKPVELEKLQQRRMSPVAAGDLPSSDTMKVHDWGDGATEATSAVAAVGDAESASAGTRVLSSARREAASGKDSAADAQPQPMEAAEQPSDAAAESGADAEAEAETEAEPGALEQYRTQRPLSIQLTQPDDERREEAVSSPTRSPSPGATEPAASSPPPSKSPVPSVPIESAQSVGELALSEETIDLSDQGETDQFDSTGGSTQWTNDEFQQQRQVVQQQFEEQQLALQHQLEQERLEEEELERQVEQHLLEQQQLKQQLREKQLQRQLEQEELEKELEQELQEQHEQQRGQQLDHQAESFPIIDLFKQQQLHQQNEMFKQQQQLHQQNEMLFKTPESLKKQPRRQQQQPQQQNELVADPVEEQQSGRQSFPIINLVKLQHRRNESIPTTESFGKQTAGTAAPQQRRQQQDELFPVNETAAQRQFKEQNELFRETYFFQQEHLQRQRDSFKSTEYINRRKSHHTEKQEDDIEERKRQENAEPYPLTDSITRDKDDVLFSGHARVSSVADPRKNAESAADVRRRSEETRRRAGDQWSRQEQRAMQEELLLQKQLMQARAGSDPTGATLKARDSWSDLELTSAAASARPKLSSQPFTRPANRTQSMVVRINRSTSSRSRSKPVYSNFCVIL